MQFILTLQDFIILAIAYAWVFGVIVIGELLRRWQNLPTTVTRKIIHLFAGFSIFTVPFYSQAWIALLVSFPMLILIFLASPRSPVKSLRTMFGVMAREEDYLSGHIWGPFLYAISINLLVATFTLFPNLIPFFVIPALGLTAMYLGDGIAPIIGAKYGKHKYTIRTAARSLEGSISVFIGSLLGAWICWIFLDVFATGGMPIFNTIQITALSLICAISATIIEGITPPGSDNLTVPLLTTLILFLSSIVIYPAILAMILTP